MKKSKPVDLSWTKEELEILHEEFFRGRGYAKRTAKRLGNRSDVSCQHKAQRTGLTRDYRHWTIQEDEILEECYASYAGQRAGHLQKAADRLKQYGRTKEACYQRAKVLGLARKPRLIWTDEELDLLDAMAGVPLRRIWRVFRGRGFNRTLTAIRTQQQIHGISQQESVEFFSCRAIAECMQVSIDTVRYWIRMGHLRAKRERMCSVYDSDPKRFYVKRADLRHFLIYQIPVWHRANPDKPWLIDMITEKGNFTSLDRHDAREETEVC